jgi:hypothetical protein
MENQLKSLANLSILGNFVGMLTDSRSFLSYTRHEYFRRILCNFLGKLVDNGEYPEDYKMLEKIRHWVEKANGAAVVTLHDPALALNYCDQLVLLKDGQASAILIPKENSLEEMETCLSQIYGAVSLQWCENRSGRRFLAMLKEADG